MLLRGEIGLGRNEMGIESGDVGAQADIEFCCSGMKRDCGQYQHSDKAPDCASKKTDSAVVWRTHCSMRA
jgi:hypothetical protein